jgi:hypothetical protein
MTLAAAPLVIEDDHGVNVILGERAQEFVRSWGTGRIALWMHVDLRSDRADSE